VLYSAVLYSTVKFNVVHKKILYCTVLFSTVHYRTVQYIKQTWQGIFIIRDHTDYVERWHFFEKPFNTDLSSPAYLILRVLFQIFTIDKTRVDTTRVTIPNHTFFLLICSHHYQNWHNCKHRVIDRVSLCHVSVAALTELHWTLSCNDESNVFHLSLRSSSVLWQKWF